MKQTTMNLGSRLAATKKNARFPQFHDALRHSLPTGNNEFGSRR